MSTYHNAFQILSDVREGINEYSTTFVNGTDTSGAYTNAFLMSQINRAQRHIYDLVMIRTPEVFLSSADIVGVDSVYALPATFGTLKIFTDDNYRKVHRIEADQLKPKEATGSDRLYYRKGTDLILDKAGITATYRLWHYKLCRNLNAGKAPAADTLATTASVTADYYNEMWIEDITGVQAAEITDYSADREITSAITLANNSYYGIVSDLPEPLCQLIAPKAVIYIKQTPQAIEKPTAQEIAAWNQDFIAAYGAVCANLDASVSEMFTDFEPGIN